MHAEKFTTASEPKTKQHQYEINYHKREATVTNVSRTISYWCKNNFKTTNLFICTTTVTMHNAQPRKLNFNTNGFTIGIDN